MITKKDAINLAKKYKWTAKDAERAYEGLNLKKATEQDLLLALITFAGPELLKRQQLQAAQKGQVTKKTKELKQVEQNLQQKLEEAQQQFHEFRSAFLPVIARIYNFAQPFGLHDPWIEALLKAYEQYHNFEEKDNTDKQDSA